MISFGDLLVFTGTDIINAILLLCGLVMLPVNVYLIYYLARGKIIRLNGKVACCPFWVAVLWILILCAAGVVMCIRRMCNKKVMVNEVTLSMNNYRDSFVHKRFIDNIQWALKCCGLNSYKDWFTIEWYDKSRDYDWATSQGIRSKKAPKFIDSVPYSCCKSGSCISNYLTELGTSSIHTGGCGNYLHRIILFTMAFYIFLFLAVIALELLVLSCVSNNSSMEECNPSTSAKYDVRHLMDIKENFSSSSESCAAADESDDEGSKNALYSNYLKR
ncbi:tetraspanin family domain-containing protein [Phthorimaea operculella]|nr:tetraspanin family domain-containing protein [Phthorimaea operculella]